MKVVYKDGIDLKDGVVIVCVLDDITDRQSAGIATVFKIPRVQCVLADFIESLPWSGPLGKHRGIVSLFGPRDILILVVFLSTLNHSVGDNVLNRPHKFRLSRGYAHVQSSAVAVLGRLVAGVERENGDG